MRTRKLVVLTFVLLLLIPAAATAAPAASTLLAGPCTAGGAYNPACDVNHDGVMDVLDVQLTAGRWGQTGAYVQNADPPCFDDANRYVDCGNGTVTDTVTGLVWLKNANCVGNTQWASGNAWAATLQDGMCGLTDNSSPGDWRLPTKAEWQATIARAVALGCTGANGPSLTDTQGTGCFSAGNQPFNNVNSSPHWSSTSDEVNPANAAYTGLGIGVVQAGSKLAGGYIWAVRSGN